MKTMQDMISNKEIKRLWKASLLDAHIENGNVVVFTCPSKKMSISFGGHRNINSVLVRWQSELDTQRWVAILELD